jgi:nitrogen-specific signal transduction histidine kinase
MRAVQGYEPCGVTPEVCFEIFDQFFTTKTSAGVLGLAAVHGIIRSHGGNIDVVSSSGVGRHPRAFIPLCGSCCEATTRYELGGPKENII